MNRWLVYGAGALICAGAMVMLLRPRLDQAPARPVQPAQLLSLGGRLDIARIDDLRVGGRKVLLCGVAYRKPEQMRELVTEAARRELSGREVACAQVGSGTPCDGRTAASFGGMPVMQCKDRDGNDIAGLLAARGYLCDSGGVSGGAYPACGG